jgi:molecular chaperone GrpE
VATQQQPGRPGAAAGAEQTAPGQPADTAAGPAHAEPAHAEPAHAEPDRAEPDRAEPDRGEPGRPEREAPDRAEAATPEAPAAEAELAELEERWRRGLADLDNLRKRYARELDRERSAERARVAASWLPVLDNLERALEHASGETDGETDGEIDGLVEGLRSVRDQAVSVLSALGYPRHDEVGMPFDPSRHEAVSVVDDPEAAPGTVVRVLRPGYGDGERQLRPAAVAVSGQRE